jgi:hypothetical protein
VTAREQPKELFIVNFVRMKRDLFISKLAFLLVFMLSASIAHAQRPVCHTSEYTQQMMDQAPGFLQRYQAIEEEVARLMTEREQFRSQDEDIYYIPVVVHIVYNVPAENISDDQVLAQIEVLNEDFRRLNEDASETPSAFADAAADAFIQFQLASIDPDGNTTTGITRTETEITSWNLFAPITAENYAEKVKETATNGKDIWDRDCYLNIWVCDLGNSILGYASPPGTTASKDGVVIGYKWFGRGGSAIPPYNQGRTTTHEVGHWLGLRHIWGDDGGNCSGSDGIADTPNQGGENYDCPSYPLTDDCSPSIPGVMFMNYMDYVDDGCMNMFTQGQVNKMRSVLSGSRGEVLACANLVVIDSQDIEPEVLVMYPNPATDQVFFPVDRINADNTVISLYNSLGQEVIRFNHDGSALASIDVSRLANGTYFIRAFDGIKTMNGKIVVSR